MVNGNGNGMEPQEQVEPGQPAAEPAEEAKSPDDGNFKSQPSLTVICPNCQQPAKQAGKEIICERCDVVFVITQKRGALVKQIGPIEELDHRVTKIEGTVGIMANDDDGPGLKEANARRAAAANAVQSDETPAAEPAEPAGPARPASQDGVATENEDEILGPR